MISKKFSISETEYNQVRSTEVDKTYRYVSTCIRYMDVYHILITFVLSWVGPFDYSLTIYHDSVK